MLGGHRADKACGRTSREQTVLKITLENCSGGSLSEAAQVQLRREMQRHDKRAEAGAHRVAPALLFRW